jgi:ribosomal protein L30/L7E
MIGLLRDKTEVSQPVTFEPERFDYYGADIFDDFDPRAAKQYSESDESKMFYSGKGQQELMQERHIAIHRRLLLQQLLNDRSINNIHFVGDGQFVHGYEIFLVIRMARKAHDSRVKLVRDHLEDNDRHVLTRSVLGASVRIFLTDAQNLLHIPNAGINLSDNPRSYAEYLLYATQELVTSLATRGKNYSGIHRFFETCENLSLSTYENEELIGSLLIAPEEHPDIIMYTTLAEPFDFADYGKTLKLLRLSRENVCVITNTVKVFGLGEINSAKYKVDSESLIRINFIGFHQWEAIHGDDQLLRMIHGNFKPIDSGFTVEKLYADAKRIFSEAKVDHFHSIFNLIQAAVAEKRGTQLIISENAESESERLKARCFKTLPKPLKPEEMTRLMYIDGGIMIDPNCNLHAYGVLLDGTVNKKGDSSRGSRYNSALTYYETQQTVNPTIIIVISDDGMVSLIPNLKPQIKHSQVVTAVEILRDMESEVNYVHQKYVEILDWLNNHRFYLRANECQQLNNSIKKISEYRLRTGGIFFGYSEYIPNEDMNDSYYLPEIL